MSPLLYQQYPSQLIKRLSHSFWQSDQYWSTFSPFYIHSSPLFLALFPLYPKTIYSSPSFSFWLLISVFSSFLQLLAPSSLTSFGWAVTPSGFLIRIWLRPVSAPGSGSLAKKECRKVLEVIYVLDENLKIMTKDRQKWKRQQFFFY